MLKRESYHKLLFQEQNVPKKMNERKSLPFYQKNADLPSQIELSEFILYKLKQPSFFNDGL